MAGMFARCLHALRCQGRSESFPPRRRKRGPLLCLAESFFLMFSFDFGGGWSGALRRP